MDVTRFKQRIQQKLERYGESITLGGSTFKGFLQPLDSTRLRIYLDDTEAQAVLKPGLFLIAGGDVNFAVNDTLTRDGRIYTVRKVTVERFGNSPVLRFAVLS